ncbi:unnamed protein product [Vicia faba]|uniref:Uncharacterized protein n=1 Tax=Vicia faba TaxID=3906 RepID=A0AAV1B2Z0_VICFA|nr:unnamed protein product [Vicia faba]
MFTSSSSVLIPEVCEVGRGKLKPNQIHWCSGVFTTCEVINSIFQMHPLKSPGPDRLPVLFFHKYLNIVGEDISNLALEILNSGKDPSSINNTGISRIPKCKTPISPNDLRPISLCNIVMKVVTKTIANRIKEILPL